MADPLRKVRRGEALSIPAEAWNRLMDIARADGSDRLLGDAEQGAARRDLDVALVKNTTSRDLPLWGGITLGAPVFPPASGTGGSLPQDFAERTVLTGVEPAACPGRGAVLLQPLAPGAIGRAVVSGILCCRVRVPASGMRRAAFVPWDVPVTWVTQLSNHMGDRSWRRRRTSADALEGNLRRVGTSSPGEARTGWDLGCGGVTDARDLAQDGLQVALAA